jgi:hypothetical protein
MSLNNLKVFTDKLQTTNTHEKLVLTAGLLELVRRAQASKLSSFFTGAPELLKSMQHVNWAAVPFSITQTLLSHGRQVAEQYGAKPEETDEILLAALDTFSEFIAGGIADADVPPAALLDALIAEITENRRLPVAANIAANPAASEIYNERMLLRGFKPKPFTDKLATTLEAGCVLFRDKLANGAMGPELRGLAFENGTNSWYVLLETGEYVCRRKGDDSVVGTNSAEDYANICPVLLAYATIVAEQLEHYAVLSPDQRAVIASNALGEFTTQHIPVVATKETLASLEQVIDAEREAASIGVTGATGPVGASVRFPVPATEFTIVIDAVPSTYGAYVVAKLTHGEKVLMRLEHPRQFSARGVYLFPLPGCLISLSAIY